MHRDSRRTAVKTSDFTRRHSAHRPSPAAVNPPSAEASQARLVTHDALGHLFTTVAPGPQGSVGEQVEQAIGELRDALDAVSAAIVPVRLTIFVAQPEILTLAGPRFDRAFRPGHTSGPVIDWVYQPPADGSAISIEAWSHLPSPTLEIVPSPHRNEIRVRHRGIEWVHVSTGSSFDDLGQPARLYDSSRQRIGDLEAALHAQAAGLPQVVRTWLYLGDIVGSEHETQRYKELNRARTDAFQGIRFQARRGDGSPGAYPASTGIGANGRGLLCGALALVTDRDDVRAIALENPRQTAAFDYSAYYSPSSPKFSRALAVVVRDDALFFVSGTASITGSETRHAGDVTAQTTETLDNIEALISEPNLARHGQPGRGGRLADLAVARVYVKHPDYYQAVRAVCRNRLGATPTCFTIADVCRPDLLVEIEGIARTSSPRGSNPESPES